LQDLLQEYDLKWLKKYTNEHDLALKNEGALNALKDGGDDEAVVYLLISSHY
jgi:hypothetical protein